MLTSFHKGLLVALGVQVLLLLVVITRGHDTGTLAPHYLIPGLDAAKVTKLTISSSESKPAVELTKKGSDWVVTSAFDYPVDASKVTALLSPLAKMQGATPIASQSSRHKQLKVADDDYERKVTITADGKTATVYIGGSAGARRNAVRMAGDDDVYGVKDVTPYIAGADNGDWTGSKYTSVDREEVAKISIHHGATTIELSHDAAGTPWNVAANGSAMTEPLDTTAVNRLADDAMMITMSAPADPKRDASNPIATVTIERRAKKPADDKTAASVAPPPPVVLDIVDAGDKYWVKQRDLGRAALVDKGKIDPLVQVEKAKLIKPPEPAGKGSGAGSAAHAPKASEELPPLPGGLMPPPPE